MLLVPAWDTSHAPPTRRTCRIENITQTRSPSPLERTPPTNAPNKPPSEAPATVPVPTIPSVKRRRKPPTTTAKTTYHQNRKVEAVRNAEVVATPPISQYPRKIKTEVTNPNISHLLLGFPLFVKTIKIIMYFLKFVNSYRENLDFLTKIK